jgi:hypothetical protein
MEKNVENQIDSLKENNLNLDNNPISFFGNEKLDFQQNNLTKNNVFIQKRNRMEDSEFKSKQKDQLNEDKNSKEGDMSDTYSDIKMKSPKIIKDKLHQTNKTGNNHEQFVCKKMSVDLEEDDEGNTNSNIVNKKMSGCNCKNSGCLKRYCECFSRMKYCNESCQCKNCINNVKFEKEREEAIKVYLVKSPVSFKKINLDLNNITCNCKKSNCLKNYCECFQYNLKCTFSCGCVDCKNRNLFEKKLFYVENNCNNNKKLNNIDNNIIKLQEENIDNDKNNNNINNIDKFGKKIINNPQFIVNKDVNINNISTSKLKNRTRYFSFDDDISQISQWNNLNLKKIEISNQKLIIDNYNVNDPENISYLYQGLQNNTNNMSNVNFSNNINIRKNSAFSAIIK